jgi:hypothetical protein
MTKRRMKNAGPTGFNKNLGNQLVNQGKAKRVYIQPNIARTASPEKVLDSVTHESNLEEFLTTAELANKDFTAERGNFKIISTLVPYLLFLLYHYNIILLVMMLLLLILMT